MKADKIFIDNVNQILTSGYNDVNDAVRPKWDDGAPAHTISSFGITNTYDLQDEFPIMTLRKINYRAAIDELLWIWQKKSNNVNDLNSHIWDSWADENGSIGKAYGYQLGVKHHYPEGEMDQVDRVLYDLKHNSASRRILTNIYNHADLSEMNLYPCAYSCTFVTQGDTLNMILNQRSQDMVVANNWNVLQYSVLLHMFAQVSNLKPGKLIHVIANAHIYDRHIDICKKIIQNPIYDGVKFKMDKSIKNFYDFTVDSFEFENYQYSPSSKIPVAV